MTTWLQHVKKVHAAGSTSFKESLKRASASWKKSKGGKAESKAADSKAAPKKRRKKKKAAEPISTDEPAAPVKKKRRRAKKSMPSLPEKHLKNIDSRSLR